MTETTWTSAGTGIAARRETRGPAVVAAIADLWNRAVVAPLHRALDAGLRAGELRELGSGTLTDIGYRRG